MQFDRIVGEKRVINAGSLGMPYENQPGAYWAIFDEGVSLRHTEYDFVAAAEASANSVAPTPRNCFRGEVLDATL